MIQNDWTVGFFTLDLALVWYTTQRSDVTFVWRCDSYSHNKDSKDMSFDLFVLHVPEYAVNEGGYIESAVTHHQLYAKLGEREASTAKEIPLRPVLHQILAQDLQILKIYWHQVEKNLSNQDVQHVDLADTEADERATFRTDGNWEVKFSVPNDRTECIMNTLLRMGIGDRFGHIWITRLDVCRPRRENKLDVMTTPDQQFSQSIKSRSIVEKVVESVRASAVFSFDYVFLLIVASTIAMLGLVYNNMVAIVASMVRLFCRISVVKVQPFLNLVF